MVLIIASVKHGISQCSLLCIINSVILQFSVYLGHRNQTKQFVFINDSKIFYPKLLLEYLLMTTLGSSPCIKWNPPNPHKKKSQAVCIYLSEKMVFSRTLHKPTTTNKMGEAEKQIYHRLQINMSVFFLSTCSPLPMQIPKSTRMKSLLQRDTSSPTIKYILKKIYQISGKTFIWKKENQIDIPI